MKVLPISTTNYRYQNPTFQAKIEPKVLEKIEAPVKKAGLLVSISAALYKFRDWVLGPEVSLSDIPLPVAENNSLELLELLEIYRNDKPALLSMLSEVDEYGDTFLHYADPDEMRIVHSLLTPEERLEFHSIKNNDLAIPLQTTTYSGGVIEIYHAVSDYPEKWEEFNLSKDVDGRIKLHDSSLDEMQVLYSSFINSPKTWEILNTTADNRGSYPSHYASSAELKYLFSTLKDSPEVMADILTKKNDTDMLIIDTFKPASIKKYILDVVKDLATNSDLDKEQSIHLLKVYESYSETFGEIIKYLRSH